MAEKPERDAVVRRLEALASQARPWYYLQHMNPQSAAYRNGKMSGVDGVPYEDQVDLGGDIAALLGMDPEGHMDFVTPSPSGPWTPTLLGGRALARVLGGESAEESLTVLEAAWRYNSADIVEVMALWGMHPTDSFEVRNGIWLRPLSEVPPSGTRDELLGIKAAREVYPGSDFRTLRARPTAALTHSSVANPLLAPLPLDPKLKRPPSRYDEMADIARVLTLLTDRAVRRIAHWEQTPVEHPLVGARSGGSGGAIHWGDAMLLDPEPLDQERAQVLVEGFFRMKRGAKQRLSTVLDRLNSAKGRLTEEDRAIDLGAALEALLFPPNDGTTEITFKLRVRGAILASNDAEERRRVFHLLGRLYSHRSQAAHGGAFDNDYYTRIRGDYRKRFQSPMVDIRDGISITMQMVSRVLEMRRLPDDWNGLILGWDSLPAG